MHASSCIKNGRHTGELERPAYQRFHASNASRESQLDEKGGASWLDGSRQ